MDVDYTKLLGSEAPVILTGVQGNKGAAELRVNLLHDLVAEQIAGRKGPLQTKDIRFLRTYLGLTPLVFKKRLDLDENADLAALLPPDAEARLRREVCEEAGAPVLSTEELEALIAQDADPKFRISIDVSDPNCYRVLLAA